MIRRVTPGLGDKNVAQVLPQHAAGLHRARGRRCVVKIHALGQARGLVAYITDFQNRIARDLPLDAEHEELHVAHFQIARDTVTCRRARSGDIRRKWIAERERRRARQALERQHISERRVIRQEQELVVVIHVEEHAVSPANHRPGAGRRPPGESDAGREVVAVGAVDRRVLGERRKFEIALRRVKILYVSRHVDRRAMDLVAQPDVEGQAARYAPVVLSVERVVGHAHVARGDIARCAHLRLAREPEQKVRQVFARKISVECKAAFLGLRNELVNLPADHFTTQLERMRAAVDQQVVGELEIVLRRVIGRRAAGAQAGVAADRHERKIGEARVARHQRNVILRGEVRKRLERRVVKLDSRIAEATLVHDRQSEYVRFGEHDALRGVLRVNGERRNGRRAAVLNLAEAVAREQLVVLGETMVGAAQVVVVGHGLAKA